MRKWLWYGFIVLLVSASTAHGQVATVNQEGDQIEVCVRRGPQPRCQMFALVPWDTVTLPGETVFITDTLPDPETEAALFDCVDNLGVCQVNLAAALARLDSLAAIPPVAGMIEPDSVTYFTEIQEDGGQRIHEILHLNGRLYWTGKSPNPGAYDRNITSADSTASAQLLLTDMLYEVGIEGGTVCYRVNGAHLPGLWPSLFVRTEATGASTGVPTTEPSELPVCG